MNAESNDPSTARNIILIGFMGSGKSTVGRELGKLLGYPLIDTDQQISKAETSTIPEIFATKGETYFRQRETSLIEQLNENNIHHHIIATGGGLPMQTRNHPILRKLGYIVWLQADTDTILERTSRNNNRPLLQTADPRGTIETLLAERTPIYQEIAHLTIPTSGLDISETAHGILESARYFFAST